MMSAEAVNATHCRCIATDWEDWDEWNVGAHQMEKSKQDLNMTAQESNYVSMLFYISTDDDITVNALESLGTGTGTGTGAEIRFQCKILDRFNWVSVFFFFSILYFHEGNKFQ